jgi:hypothetical protein
MFCLVQIIKVKKRQGVRNLQILWTVDEGQVRLLLTKRRGSVADGSRAELRMMSRIIRRKLLRDTRAVAAEAARRQEGEEPKSVRQTMRDSFALGVAKKHERVADEEARDGD